MPDVVHVSYRNMNPLPQAEREVARQGRLLGEHFPEVQHIHVSLEAMGGDAGGPVKAFVAVQMPGHRVVASRHGIQDRLEDSALQALVDAFNAARQGLQETRRMMRGHLPPDCCN